MTEITSGHPLVERISRLRGRVRLVLGLFGAGLIVSAALAGLWVLAVGDYLVHFSSSTRLFLLVVALAGLGYLVWRKLVTPLSTKLTEQFLASRVEALDKNLADELVSAVHFVRSGTTRSNAFAARHVETAQTKTAGLRFEDALDFRMANRSLAVAVTLVAVTTLVALLNPQSASTVFGRWIAFDPDAHWPRTTTVEFAWNTPDGKQPAVLPIGEQFAVQAKVTRGGYENQRVWLYTSSDSQSRETEELMTFQREQSGRGNYLYERAIEPVGNKALYLRLVAGDHTDMEPVKVRLAARPVVSELLGSIEPPAYVKNLVDATKPAPAVTVDLLAQTGRAVEGARITLRIKSTKAFGKDAKGQPDVRFVDQAKDVDVALADVAQRLIADDVAEVSFTARQPLQVRAMMRDVDGFENRVGGTMSIEVVPDALPSVVITEPRRMVERSPDAQIKIVVQATDDLGLDGLKLVAEKFDAKPGEAPAFTVDLPWEKRMVDSAVGAMTGSAEYTWDLSPLKLSPGARLSFYVAVQDNYEVKNANPAQAAARPFMITELGTIRHEWVKSAPLSLQIKSVEEILDRGRKDLNEIKERIKNLKDQQEQTKAQTDAIQKAIETSGVSTEQQKRQLGELAQQQSQETASANAIQQRVEQIKQDFEQNKLGESELGKLAAEVSKGMKDVGQNNMPKAASELSKAQESAAAQQMKSEQSKEAAKSAGKAGEQQQEAIAKMESMINQLGAAGDFEAVRQKLDEIIKKQDEVAKATREAMAKNPGAKPEDLPKDQKEQLDKLAAKQAELSRQTAGLTEQMRKASQQLSQSDPASAESLSKAADASDSASVPQKQGDAAQNINNNQSSRSSNNQQQAQAGLDQMKSELDKQNQRQLEQLSRQLADLLKELQALAAEEKQINTETIKLGEAGAKKEFLVLGDRQQRTQQNTIVTQKKAENTRDAKKAAGDVKDAAEQMGTAAGALYTAKQPSAIPPEEQAIASLEAAIKKLEEQKKKVDEQLKEKDLAEFIRQYEGIKKGQEAVKTGAEGVELRRLDAADKQIDRAGLLALSGLSTNQRDLKELIQKISADEKLKEYEVVVWMNGLITDYMDQSREKMSRAQTGRQLSAVQQTAIDRINDIINALKEEKEKSSEFAKGGGGGGGGGGGKPPLVPPVAQLKLLKAMQLIVNTQTATVDKAAATAPTDAEKAEAQNQAAKLGKVQGEIKGLANKVMEKMSGP